MRKDYCVLAINPGSTSTKVAVYDGDQPLFETTIRHEQEELAQFEDLNDEYGYREERIFEVLKEENIDLEDLDGVVGRGGLVKSIPAGTYYVGEKMVEDLKCGVQGKHASNLGGMIAYAISKDLDIPSFVVDPVVVDELESVARITGDPGCKRRSIFHALNQRAIAHRASAEMGKKYGECNFVVAHLGSGITVGAHRKGKVIDVTDAIGGVGPFSPERPGFLPDVHVVDLCFSGKYTYEEMKKKFVSEGGLTAHLGTKDIEEVLEMIASGDEYAKLVFEAMAYHTAKEIGAFATVLDGEVDAVLLTGGGAYSEKLVNMIQKKVKFIAPVSVYPGEDELRALVEGVLRVLRHEEDAKIYEDDYASIPKSKAEKEAI